MEAAVGFVGAAAVAGVCLCKEGEVTDAQVFLGCAADPRNAGAAMETLQGCGCFGCKLQICAASVALVLVMERWKSTGCCPFE